MNILMLSTTFIPSILLCGHSQLDYLEKQGKINYKFIPSHFIKRETVDWADVIVFGRSDTDIDAFVSKVAKKAGKHLAYFLDDDILNCPDYLSCYPYYSLPSTKNNIKTVMANCDTFLTPSPVLLEKYGNQFNHKYLISEPSLNRIEEKKENEKIKIGFAGSIDRTQDTNNILKEAIKKIIDKYKDSVEIEFMGAHPEFVDEYNLKFLPYQDGYDAYTAYMASCNWDIGLAPMPDSPFHKCKYFNKYVEYASFGIAGVYSNLIPYTFGVKNEENGILVNNNANDWFRGISKLIEDKNLRNSISNTCLKEADEKYSLRVLAPDYYEKLINDFKKKEKYGSIPTFVFAKCLFFFKRVFRKIKEQGLNFPHWLKKKLEKKKEENKDKQLYKKNTNELTKLLGIKKTIFVLSPIFDNNNINDEYFKRVKYVDDKLKEDYYVIYLNGEDRGLEALKTRFIDGKHSYVEFNSFDINQVSKVLSLIEQSGKLLIHSVNRYIREKLSDDMYKVFDLSNVKVILDAHGAIPEKYHSLNNIHTEMVTNEIEKRLYNSVDAIIVENEELKNHFINKYSKRDIEYIIF